MTGIILERRALRRIEDVVESKDKNRGFSNAKRIANLLIEKSKYGTNKPTARGYEEAMGALYQFQFSENESEALEAKRLFTSYENKRAVILREESNRKRAVNELQLDEKKAYYFAATGMKTDFITSGNFIGLLSFQRQSLNEHLYNIQDAINAAEEVGENTASLRGELRDAYRRYKDIERLEDDILNGDGSSLKEFGVFIDGDRNGIDGVFIAKENDFPKGLNRDSYTRLNETKKVEGVQDGFINIHGEHFIDQTRNRKVVELGSRRWTLSVGVPGALQHDNKLDPLHGRKPKEGRFSMADFSVKSNPIGKNMYFTGITGRDADNNFIRTLFKSSEDGKKVFSVDDATRKKLEADPTEGEKIKYAFDRNELDSWFINERVVPNAEPFKFVPTTESAAPLQNYQPRQIEEPPQTFFGRINRAVAPQIAAVRESAPGIIKKGELFFRMNPTLAPLVKSASLLRKFFDRK